MTTDEAEKVIRESIDNCESKDIKVRPGSWGVVPVRIRSAVATVGFAVVEWHKQSLFAPICPLGAVLMCGPEDVRLRAGNVERDYAPEAARAALGVTEDWVRGFIYGVDGEAQPVSAELDAYELGVKFRAELRSK